MTGRTGTLPEIPVVRIAGGNAGLELARRHPERLEDLWRQARRRYTLPAIRLGDDISRRWLSRSHNPHLAEIDAIAGLLGRPGAHLLNLSFEWGCSSASLPLPGGGNRLLRTLDWNLAGLGRNLVVARQEGAAGPYDNVTWPGFVGVLTAMAPGRFAAAINQPPLPWTGLSRPVDWLLARRRQLAARALPPAHLLRQVFERCRTYAEAKRTLAETPLCLPAFYTICGTRPEDGCVIERTETQAMVHETPAAIANHWVRMPRRGRPRGHNSHGRLQAMHALFEAPPADLSWLRPPVLNRDTRLALVADAAAGLLTLQGLERPGAATRVLTLRHSAVSAARVTG